MTDPAVGLPSAPAVCENHAAFLGVPLYRLTDADLQRMRQPIVYVWVRGDRVLYVGLSEHGLTRPLDRGHEQLREFASGDLLVIWPSSQPGVLENALIYHLRPRRNRTAVSCPTCGATVEPITRRCWRKGHAPDASFFWDIVQPQTGRG